MRTLWRSDPAGTSDSCRTRLSRHFTSPRGRDSRRHVRLELPVRRGHVERRLLSAPRPRGFDELAYYAEHFDTVEVNSTFYRMPERRMSRVMDQAHAVVVSVCDQAVPEVHASGHVPRARRRARLGSVARRLRPVSRGHRAARRGRPARRRPRAVSAELQRHRRIARLPRLAARRPGGVPVAVELRHRSWSDEAAGHAAICCREHRAAWALIDEPEIRIVRSARPSTPRRSPKRQSRTSGSTAATPRPGGTMREAEDRYNYSVFGGGAGAVFESGARTPRRREQRVLMYLNNHFSAKSVANAAILKRDLGQIIPGTTSARWSNATGTQGRRDD